MSVATKSSVLFSFNSCKNHLCTTKVIKINLNRMVENNIKYETKRCFWEQAILFVAFYSSYLLISWWESPVLQSGLYFNLRHTWWLSRLSRYTPNDLGRFRLVVKSVKLHVEVQGSKSLWIKCRYSDRPGVAFNLCMQSVDRMCFSDLFAQVSSCKS